MKPEFNTPSDSPAKREFQFSIDRNYYALSASISILYIIFAGLLGLTGVTGILLPFAGIFLVWGISSMKVLLESPVFRLTGDAFIVFYPSTRKTHRLPLDTLNCISSHLLPNPRARHGSILVSNGRLNIIIPRRLDIDSREILGLLVERTTDLQEGKQNLSPPPQLKDIMEKFQDQGAGEKVSIFKGPKKKVSIFKRLFRKIFIMMYFMALGFVLAAVKSPRGFLEGFLILSISFGILLLLSYISYRHKPEEWFLVSPSGIAMMGKWMNGELFWYEATAIKYRRRGKSALSLGDGPRSPTGLFLIVSTRDFIFIPIPDIYDVPLPCIERIMILYARQTGARIGIPDSTHTRIG